MRIADREISTAAQPYIIAEIGVNHDGSPRRALQLVDAAADAGADAVKLQYFRADLLLSPSARPANYQRDAGDHDPFEMLRRLELPHDAALAAIERARERSIHAVVTVFSTELIGEAAAMRPDAFKTASPDIVNRPLLEALAASGPPLIVSTGASTQEEVARALEWLSPRRDRLALLHCVSSYPAHERDAALGGIHALAELFDGPVGYSDHTEALDTGALAVAAGACILEKHLTHDRAARGPDHRVSLDPAAFRRYVELARRAHRMIGGRRKRVLDCELDVRAVSRQSVCAARRIEKGATIEHADLTLRRPGDGIEPHLIETLVGRRAASTLEAGRQLREEDLS